MDTKTRKTALLSKPNPQISGSIRGKMGLNRLDKNIPAGTPSIPDVTVTTPNTSAILDNNDNGNNDEERKRNNVRGAHVMREREREKKEKNGRNGKNNRKEKKKRKKRC